MSGGVWTPCATPEGLQTRSGGEEERLYLLLETRKRVQTMWGEVQTPSHVTL